MSKPGTITVTITHKLEVDAKAWADYFNLTPEPGDSLAQAVRLDVQDYFGQGSKSGGSLAGFTAVDEFVKVAGSKPQCLHCHRPARLDDEAYGQVCDLWPLCEKQV